MMDRVLTGSSVCLPTSKGKILTQENTEVLPETTTEMEQETDRLRMSSWLSLQWRLNSKKGLDSSYISKREGKGVYLGT